MKTSVKVAGEIEAAAASCNIVRLNAYATQIGPKIYSVKPCDRSEEPIHGIQERLDCWAE